MRAGHLSFSCPSSFLTFQPPQYLSPSNRASSLQYPLSIRSSPLDLSSFISFLSGKQVFKIKKKEISNGNNIIKVTLPFPSLLCPPNLTPPNPELKTRCTTKKNPLTSLRSNALRALLNLQLRSFSIWSFLYPRPPLPNSAFAFFSTANLIALPSSRSGPGALKIRPCLGTQERWEKFESSCYRFS